MKRRPPTRGAAAPGDVPPELLVGALFEVWADDKPPPWEDGPSPRWRAHSAYRRYSRARKLWAEKCGLARGEVDLRVKPGSRVMWSMNYLDTTGRGGEVDERLASAGVCRADIPALRDAARSWAGFK